MEQMSVKVLCWTVECNKLLNEAVLPLGVVENLSSVICCYINNRPVTPTENYGDFT